MGTVALAKKSGFIPSVEDRFLDMRHLAAALFLAFDAFADDDIASGNFGEMSRDGYRGFAEMARELYADLGACEAALSGEPPDRKSYAGPFVWPAPEAE